MADEDDYKCLFKLADGNDPEATTAVKVRIADFLN